MNTDDAAKKLIDSLVKKHNIESYDDFTCPDIRALAESIKYFPILDDVTEKILNFVKQSSTPVTQQAIHLEFTNTWKPTNLPGVVHNSIDSAIRYLLSIGYLQLTAKKKVPLEPEPMSQRAMLDIPYKDSY